MKDILTCVSSDHCAKKHFRSERRLLLKATALPQPTPRFGLTLALNTKLSVVVLNVDGQHFYEGGKEAVSLKKFALAILLIGAVVGTALGQGPMHKRVNFSINVPL